MQANKALKNTTHLVHEDVLEFDIAIRNALRVQVVHGKEKLCRIEVRLLERKAFLLHQVVKE